MPIFIILNSLLLLFLRILVFGSLLAEIFESVYDRLVHLGLHSHHFDLILLFLVFLNVLIEEIIEF